MDKRLQEMLEAVPMPTADLRLSFYTLDVDHWIHRVHHSQFGATQFNPGLKGDARFSPIIDADGAAIPTMYAGTTFDCAMMETAFHEVPHTSGLKILSKSKLQNQLYSPLLVQQKLNLVDLSAVALRKMGLKRNQLIDTENITYPRTRAWAAEIYKQCPSAQGLSWVSRQDDRARAFIFLATA